MFFFLSKFDICVKRKNITRTIELEKHHTPINEIQNNTLCFFFALHENFQIRPKIQTFCNGFLPNDQGE